MLYFFIRQQKLLYVFSPSLSKEYTHVNALFVEKDKLKTSTSYTCKLTHIRWKKKTKKH